MKNISSELELKETPARDYLTNNVLTSCDAVMGREVITIKNNNNNNTIQTEYPIDPAAVLSATISSASKEIDFLDEIVLKNRCHRSATINPHLVSTPDCDHRNEINSRYSDLASHLAESPPTVFRAEKLCMYNGNDGAETRRMVRSASVGHDLPFQVQTATLTTTTIPDNSAVSDTEIVTGNESGISSEFDSTTLQCFKAGVRRGSCPSAMGKLESSSPCTLAAVLERIPLAYNPRTKQLHIISVTPSSPEINSSSLHSSEEIDELENVLSHTDNGQVSDLHSRRDRTQEQQFNQTPRKESGLKQQNDKSESCPTGCLTQDKTIAALSRAPTCGSLQSKTDCCSSFSSISSLSTDFSVSTASPFEDQNNDTVTKCNSIVVESEGPGFIEINLDRQSLRSVDSSCPLNVDQNVAATQGAKPKRLALPGFFSRNLLSWKSKEPGFPDVVPGWKLFGKTSQQQAQTRTTTGVRSGEDCHESGSPSADGCATPRTRKNDDLVASSTTALILENRPGNLPAKLPEEEIKHRLEYEQMVEAAKKKELKEAKQKKKLLQQQLRYEEQLCLASKIWNTEILPAWDTMKQSRKSRDLWWQGIPPSVRGKVWKLAIGNDLHITPELYEICVCRAKDRIRMAAESISISEYDVEVTDKEGSVELIKLDVSRTFPQLCIFQKGGPYYDMLHSLLGAYVCYRPDVGYVQGMSFLAAVLILNLEVADAFICFANLLNQPCQLAFFRLDEPMMKSYFLTYEEFFRENLPKLYNHFTRQNLSPDLYLIDWIYTVYSRSLPLDVASRVWDVYFRDGDEFLFRTALGILRLYQDILLNMDFIHLAQFLTKLPEAIAAEPLFKAIGYIRMTIEKRNFSQVLLTHVESRQT